MSIWTRYRAWEAARQRLLDMQEFTAGYNLAAGRMLAEYSSPQSLESEADVMGWSGKFYKGVSCAITEAIKKGMVKDDRYIAGTDEA